MAKYVTGDNAHGYMPESDPRGPWDSWADAVKDVRAMISDECDNLAECNPDDAATLSDQAESVLSAFAACESEDPRGVDVIYAGRAYFIRQAEPDQ